MLPIDSSLSVAAFARTRIWKSALGMPANLAGIIKRLPDHARRHRLHRQCRQRWMISAVARVTLQWPLLQ
jgi:hypothetical protein